MPGSATEASRKPAEPQRDGRGNERPAAAQRCPEGEPQQQGVVERQGNPQVPLREEILSGCNEVP